METHLVDAVSGGELHHALSDGARLSGNACGQRQTGFAMRTRRPVVRGVDGRARRGSIAPDATYWLTPSARVPAMGVGTFCFFAGKRKVKLESFGGVLVIGAVKAIAGGGDDVVANARTRNKTVREL